MDWADTVDHLSQTELARWLEAVPVLLSDAVRVSRQYDEVALCFAHQKSVLANRCHSGAPDGLEMAPDFNELVVGATRPWDIFDNADTLHEVGYHDNVTDDSDVDGCGRGSETGELLELHGAEVIVDSLVNNNLDRLLEQKNEW